MGRLLFNPMRTALIGYGLGGSAFHAPFLNTTPGLGFSAVVTGNPERAAEVRSRYPRVEVLSSVDQVWTGNYDLAVVTTPNRFHHEHAGTALEHGLHVVVDKPFSGTSAEARTLAERAETNNRVLVPFHNRRWDGDFLTAQQLLTEGELGDVHRFESRFERWRPEPKQSWKESGDPADLGSILFDLGTHLIDQAITLFGRPTHVYAELRTLRNGAKTDDDTFLALTHTNGTVSHLWASALAANPGPRFRLLGTKAAYVKHGMDPQEEQLKAGKAPTNNNNWGADPKTNWGTLQADNKETPVPTLNGNYPAFYTGVATALNNNTPPPVSPWDAVTGLEIIEAATKSAHTKQTITL